MMKLNWGGWLYGLIGGFIGGGAGAIGAGGAGAYLDPEHFGAAGGLHRILALMGASFVITGIITAAAYLMKSPLPQIETTVSVATTTQVGTEPKIVTTVSATTQDVKPVENPVK